MFIEYTWKNSVEVCLLYIFSNAVTFTFIIRYPVKTEIATKQKREEKN